MKKILFTLCLVGLLSGAAVAQVADRAGVPVEITLVQILRIHVTNGSNIEFVFNDINDLKGGINNLEGNGFYTSDIQIASSSNWQLDMGTEDATFMGTDNPANLMTLNNVGFTVSWMGVNTCCGAVLDVDDVTGTVYNDCIDPLGIPSNSNSLLPYAGTGTVILFTAGATGNGGDVLDNAFSIFWEAGTHDAVWGVPTYPNSVINPMNTSALLNQSLAPDRYVTNVFLELTAF